MAELVRKYVVMAAATPEPFDPSDPDGAFVLKPWKDPAALQALVVYREHCYAELAEELDQWIAAIVAGPKIRGGIGSRNELTAPARRNPAPKARPKGKSKVKRSKQTKKKAKRRA